MKGLHLLRLALIGLVLLLLQLTFYLKYPGLRAGADLYIVFVLVITAAHGSAVGGLFALLGGMLMDAPSQHLTAFHTLYYMLPVVFGSVVRSYMLVEFHLLGLITTTTLLLGKILVPLVILVIIGKLDSMAYVYRTNYWGLVLVLLIVGLAWRQIIALVQNKPEGRFLG